MLPELNQWLILELNDTFENITYKDIENAIINAFGDVEYFIPIAYEKMGSYISTDTLLEGYAFIKDCLEIRQNMFNIREEKVFTGFLCYDGKYQTVSSRIIGNLKRKLKASLKKKCMLGSKVKILDGVFKNLTGEVIGVEDQGKKIMVRIKRLSREIIAPIPSTIIGKIK